jgi:hypothetical protein
MDHLYDIQREQGKEAHGIVGPTIGIHDFKYLCLMAAT